MKPTQKMWAELREGHPKTWTFARFDGIQISVKLIEMCCLGLRPPHQLKWYSSHCGNCPELVIVGKQPSFLQPCHSLVICVSTPKPTSSLGYAEVPNVAKCLLSSRSARPVLMWYTSYIGGFHKLGVSQSWMVYKGKSKLDDWGYPHDWGNLHIALNGGFHEPTWLCLIFCPRGKRWSTPQKSRGDHIQILLRVQPMPVRRHMPRNINQKYGGWNINYPWFQWVIAQNPSISATSILIWFQWFQWILHFSKLHFDMGRKKLSDGLRFTHRPASPPMA